jgi:hypothetical protein
VYESNFSEKLKVVDRGALNREVTVGNAKIQKTRPSHCSHFCLLPFQLSSLRKNSKTLETTSFLMKLHPGSAQDNNNKTKNKRWQPYYYLGRLAVQQQSGGKHSNLPDFHLKKKKTNLLALLLTIEAQSSSDPSSSSSSRGGQQECQQQQKPDGAQQGRLFNKTKQTRSGIASTRDPTRSNDFSY